jgi:exocyst complex component 4
MVEHSKISATWAVDEDISRLLKSLPSWTVIVSQTPATELTPTGMLNLNESEQEIRQRTQRESEILISNLGVQKEIDRFAVITDLDYIRSIICIHESLQWFCMNMRALIANIPKKAKETMKCTVQIRSPNGDVVEQVNIRPDYMRTIKNNLAKKTLLIN